MLVHHHTVRENERFIRELIDLTITKDNSHGRTSSRNPEFLRLAKKWKLVGNSTRDILVRTLEHPPGREYYSISARERIIIKHKSIEVVFMLMGGDTRLRAYYELHGDGPKLIPM